MSSGAGMNCSGYPYMPCSAMSRPASSSSSVTRRPIVFLIAQNTTYETTNTHTNAVATPSACAPSWWKLPEYTRPGLPIALRSASRGDVNRPQASVPQMPATPCADSAPTGSSRTLSIASTQTTTSTPATPPMIGAAQYST